MDIHAIDGEAQTAAFLFPPTASALNEDLPAWLMGWSALAEAPTCLLDLRASDIAARVRDWRGMNPQLDALFTQNQSPCDALRRFGLTLWGDGLPAAAVEVFRVVAALAPSDAAVWLDFGSVLHVAGRTTDAYEVLERAVVFDSAVGRCWLALALAANELGHKARAGDAFQAALSCDALLSDAHFGLGLLSFEDRRYEDAVRHWREALAMGVQNPLVHFGLGQSLFFIGDFVGAGQAFDAAAAAGLIVSEVRERRALCRFVQAAICGDFENGRSVFASDMKLDDAGLRSATRSVFHILSGYGYREQALHLGRSDIFEEKEEPIRNYLLAAVEGKSLLRAPTDYLVAHFDQFAENFDRQLVGVLGYRVPVDLANLLSETGKVSPRAVDLGCGTGLGGPTLRPGKQILVGVDISPGMLAKARERKIYDALVEADILDFLDSTNETYDLVYAADVLIYFGELQPFFASAARVLESGGALAFNLEVLPGRSFELLPSGRFAHNLGAALNLASAWFTIDATRPTSARFEAGRRVGGALVVLERR